MGLFKPAYLSNNAGKAISALDKITDVNKFFEVLEYDNNDFSDKVKLAVIDHINDNQTLLRIIKDKKIINGATLVKDKSLSKISDQKVYTYIVFDEDIIDEYRKKAAYHITQKEYLVLIITKNITQNISGEIKNTAWETLKKILDNSDLTTKEHTALIIIESKNTMLEKIKVSAVKYVFSTDMLINIAKSNSLELSYKAITKLSSSNVWGIIKLITQTDISDKVRLEALKSIIGLKLNSENARKLIPYEEMFSFYVNLIWKDCEDEELKEKAEDKVRFIENHEIKSSIVSRRYTVSGHGELILKYPGHQDKVYEIKGNESMDITIFNGSLVEYDNTVTLTYIPYSDAEEADYQMYLYATATDNI